MITTSRRPTRRTRSFCKDLQVALPNAIRVNRGKMSLSDVALRALELGADRIILVSVYKGNPGRIRFFKVSSSEFIEIPPTINIAGIKLTREFNKSRRINAGGIFILCSRDYVMAHRDFIDKLSYALKAKVATDANSIPLTASILRIEASKAGFCTLLFSDVKGVPVGPLIRVKSAWLDLKSPFTSWVS